jgi:hypothetical protein
VAGSFKFCTNPGLPFLPILLVPRASGFALENLPELRLDFLAEFHHPGCAHRRHHKRVPTGCSAAVDNVAVVITVQHDNVNGTF